MGFIQQDQGQLFRQKNAEIIQICKKKEIMPVDHGKILLRFMGVETEQLDCRLQINAENSTRYHENFIIFSRQKYSS